MHAEGGGDDDGWQVRGVAGAMLRDTAPHCPPSVITVMTGRRPAVRIMNQNEYNNKTVVVEKLKT